MKLQLKSTRHYFTLVELLVVIAILAILMSLLQPALINAIWKAKNIACMTNLKQQGLALAMYCDDNMDKYPNKWAGSSRHKDGGVSIEHSYGMLLPYFPDKASMKSAFICPFVLPEIEKHHGPTTFPYNRMQSYQLYYNIAYENRVGWDHTEKTMMNKLGQRWQYGKDGGAASYKWFDIVSSDPIMSRLRRGVRNFVTHPPIGAPIVRGEWSSRTDINVGHGAIAWAVADTPYWNGAYNANYLFSDGSVQHRDDLFPDTTLNGSWMWKVPADFGYDEP